MGVWVYDVWKRVQERMTLIKSEGTQLRTTASFDAFSRATLCGEYADRCYGPYPFVLGL